MSHWRSALILCVCACLAAFFRVSAQADARNRSNGLDENVDRRYSLPAYAVASTAVLLNSTICRKELQDFRDAIDQRILWSLRMLDSSGEPRSGFLYGNNYWLGSRNQCYDTMNTDPLEITEQQLLNNTRYRDPEKEFPPFEVRYFVAHFRQNSTLQYHVDIPDEDVITLGLCLPASCSTSELSSILEKIFHDRTLLIGDIYSADFTLIEVKDLKDDHRWLYSSSSFFMCIVVVFTFLMMIIGTAYDIFVYQNCTSMKNASARGLREEIEFTALSSDKENRIAQVLMCFSVYTNTRRIFDTNLSANSIPAIHGLRFLSMGWAILAHCLLYMKAYIDNKIWVWRMSEGFVSQIISNPTIAVDTYFFQSGCLVAYLYLNNRTSKEQTKPINCRAKLTEFFFLVMSRFIRLTPAYMMTLGMLLLTSSWHDETSLFYMDEKSQETCAKYWWRNLLYINNLFDYKSMCMSWSWYLANDMQFFVIGVILLILSSTCFYATVVILGILLTGSIVLAGYISYIYEYVPITTELYKIINVLYNPPWIRIGPYIIGMITGYILVKLNNKLVLKRTTVMLCWCFGSSCNILVLFGLYNRQISVLSTAVYVALSRTVWAIGIAWIVIACCTKHGGIVNQLLSFKGWIPLSRLTYCAYLVNPVVIQFVRLYSEASVHVGFLSTGIVYLGYVFASFLVAYILSLTAEAPYITLMRTITQSRDRKKHKPRKNMISFTKI